MYHLPTMPTLTPVLRLEYEVRTKNGAILESSDDRGLLELEPGRRRLLPALEEVIAGLRVGQEARGELPSTRAFGDESVLPTMAIARSEFPVATRPEPGQRFEATTPIGDFVRFSVLSADEGFVQVRLLHPLNEADLEYRFKLLAITDRGAPPPLPAHVLGIDSAAIELIEERSGPAS
jgi:FKBP-type peptidyl-prolyl cis-trans isomerase SlyD